MKKIRALFIFEIMGNPPEYIKTALEGFIDKLGTIKGVSIINKKVHEPKLIEDKENKQKGLFTTFGETEIETDTLSTLFGITFHMLPSHVEIIEPEEIKLTNFELSPIITELAVKLHKYDEIAKTMIFEKENMLAHIRQMENNTNNNVITIGNSDMNPATITKEDVKKEKVKNSKKKKKR